MDGYKIYRVVEFAGETWDGHRLQISDEETGKWADLMWSPNDKHIRTDFYDSEGLLQEERYEMYDDNPLEYLYRTSPNACEDILYEYEEEEEFDVPWGIW